MSNFNRSQGNRGNQGGGHNNSQNKVVREEDAMKLPADYVDKASQVMRELRDSCKKLTTSKIRRILTMVNELREEAEKLSGDQLTEEMRNNIQYLRMRIAYESGREELVKTFAQEAHLIGYLKNIGNSKKALLEYTSYMEALVAYHRFYGGEET